METQKTGGVIKDIAFYGLEMSGSEDESEEPAEESSRVVAIDREVEKNVAVGCGSNEQTTNDGDGRTEDLLDGCGESLMIGLGNSGSVPIVVGGDVEDDVTPRVDDILGDGEQPNYEGTPREVLIVDGGEPEESLLICNREEVNESPVVSGNVANGVTPDDQKNSNLGGNITTEAVLTAGHDKHEKSSILDGDKKCSELADVDGKGENSRVVDDILKNGQPDIGSALMNSADDDGNVGVEPLIDNHEMEEEMASGKREENSIIDNDREKTLNNGNDEMDVSTDEENEEESSTVGDGTAAARPAVADGNVTENITNEGNLDEQVVDGIGSEVAANLAEDGGEKDDDATVDKDDGREDGELTEDEEKGPSKPVSEKSSHEKLLTKPYPYNRPEQYKNEPISRDLNHSKPRGRPVERGERDGRDGRSNELRVPRRLKYWEWEANQRKFIRRRLEESADRGNSRRYDNSKERGDSGRISNRQSERRPYQSLENNRRRNRSNERESDRRWSRDRPVYRGGEGSRRQEPKDRGLNRFSGRNERNSTRDRDDRRRRDDRDRNSSRHSTERRRSYRETSSANKDSKEEERSKIVSNDVVLTAKPSEVVTGETAHNSQPEQTEKTATPASSANEQQEELKIGEVVHNTSTQQGSDSDKGRALVLSTEETAKEERKQKEAEVPAASRDLGIKSSAEEGRTANLKCKDDTRVPLKKIPLSSESTQRAVSAVEQTSGDAQQSRGVEHNEFPLLSHDVEGNRPDPNQAPLIPLTSEKQDEKEPVHFQPFKLKSQNNNDKRTTADLVGVFGHEKSNSVSPTRDNEGINDKRERDTEKHVQQKRVVSPVTHDNQKATQLDGYRQSKLPVNSQRPQTARTEQPRERSVGRPRKENSSEKPSNHQKAVHLPLAKQDRKMDHSEHPIQNQSLLRRAEQIFSNLNPEANNSVISQPVQYPPSQPVHRHDKMFTNTSSLSLPKSGGQLPILPKDSFRLPAQKPKTTTTIVEKYVTKKFDTTDDLLDAVADDLKKKEEEKKLQKTLENRAHEAKKSVSSGSSSSTKPPTNGKKEENNRAGLTTPRLEIPKTASSGAVNGIASKTALKPETTEPQPAYHTKSLITTFRIPKKPRAPEAEPVQKKEKQIKVAERLEEVADDSEPLPLVKPFQEPKTRSSRIIMIGQPLALKQFPHSAVRSENPKDDKPRKRQNLDDIIAEMEGHDFVVNMKKIEEEKKETKKKGPLLVEAHSMPVAPPKKRMRIDKRQETASNACERKKEKKKRVSHSVGAIESTAATCKKVSHLSSDKQTQPVPVSSLSISNSRDSSVPLVEKEKPKKRQRSVELASLGKKHLSNDGDNIAMSTAPEGKETKEEKRKKKQFSSCVKKPDHNPSPNKENPIICVSKPDAVPNAQNQKKNVRTLSAKHHRKLLSSSSSDDESEIERTDREKKKEKKKKLSKRRSNEGSENKAKNNVHEEEGHSEEKKQRSPSPKTPDTISLVHNETNNVRDLSPAPSRIWSSTSSATSSDEGDIILVDREKQKKKLHSVDTTENTAGSSGEIPQNTGDENAITMIRQEEVDKPQEEELISHVVQTPDLNSSPIEKNPIIHVSEPSTFSHVRHEEKNMGTMSSKHYNKRLQLSESSEDENEINSNDHEVGITMKGVETIENNAASPEKISQIIGDNDESTSAVRDGEFDKRQDKELIPPCVQTPDNNRFSEDSIICGTDSDTVPNAQNQKKNVRTLSANHHSKLLSSSSSDDESEIERTDREKKKERKKKLSKRRSNEGSENKANNKVHEEEGHSEVKKRRAPSARTPDTISLVQKNVEALSPEPSKNLSSTSSASSSDESEIIRTERERQKKKKKLHSVETAENTAGTSGEMHQSIGDRVAINMVRDEDVNEPQEKEPISRVVQTPDLNSSLIEKNPIIHVSEPVTLFHVRHEEKNMGTTSSKYYGKRLQLSESSEDENEINRTDHEKGITMKGVETIENKAASPEKMPQIIGAKEIRDGEFDQRQDTDLISPCVQTSDNNRFSEDPIVCGTKSDDVSNVQSQKKKSPKQYPKRLPLSESSDDESEINSNVREGKGENKKEWSQCVETIESGHASSGEIQLSDRSEDGAIRTASEKEETLSKGQYSSNVNTPDPTPSLMGENPIIHEIERGSVPNEQSEKSNVQAMSPNNWLPVMSESSGDESEVDSPIREENRESEKEMSHYVEPIENQVASSGQVQKSPIHPQPQLVNSSGFKKRLPIKRKTEQFESPTSAGCSDGSPNSDDRSKRMRNSPTSSDGSACSGIQRNVSNIGNAPGTSGWKKPNQSAPNHMSELDKLLDDAERSLTLMKNGPEFMEASEDREEEEEGPPFWWKNEEERELEKAQIAANEKARQENAIKTANDLISSVYPIELDIFYHRKAPVAWDIKIGVGFLKHLKNEREHYISLDIFQHLIDSLIDKLNDHVYIQKVEFENYLRKIIFIYRDTWTGSKAARQKIEYFEHLVNRFVNGKTATKP